MASTPLVVATVVTLLPLPSVAAQPWAATATGSTPTSMVIVAPADDDGQSPRDRAKVKVEQGTQLYEQGNYEEALAAFQDAASLYASPDFQYNIGLCHERLGNYTAAVVAFETYLRNKPEAGDRIAVEGRIRDIKERVALEERANAEKKPTEPPPEQKPAEPPPEQKPEPTQPVDDGDELSEQDEGDGRGLIIGGSVMLGVGVLGAAGGGIAFGTLARSPAASVNAVLNEGNPQGRTLAETQQLADEADRFRTAQVISLAAGAALATAGLAMLLVGQKRRRQSAKTAQFRISPHFGGVTLSGTF